MKLKITQFLPVFLFLLLVSSTTYAQGVQFQINSWAVAPNMVTPANQIDDIGLMLTIENVGDQPATVTFSVSTGFISTAGSYSISSNVYSEESSVVQPGQLLEDWVLDYSFAPGATPFQHAVLYSIASGNSEQDTAVSVYVTPSLYAKERTELVTIPIPTTSIAPDATTDYAYGNVFYLKNGDNTHAREIQFVVTNANELAGRNVKIELYEWEGDTNGNFKVDPSEYGGEPAGRTNYTFTGNEGDQPIKVYADQGGSIPVQSDRYYIPMIKYTATDGQKMFLKASEEVDYGDMIRLTAMGDTPQYATALDIGNTGTLDLEGFGHHVVPVVQLLVGTQPIVATEELTLSEASVQLSPNPVADQLQLNLDLESIASRVTLQLIDVNGKVLHSRQLANTQKEQVEFDVHQFASGNYFLRVQTDQGQRTLPFIVEY